jgi:hypothetical protein
VDNQVTTPAAGEAVTPALPPLQVSEDPTATELLHRKAPTESSPDKKADPGEPAADKPGEGESEGEGKKRNRVSPAVRIAKYAAEAKVLRAENARLNDRIAALEAPKAVDVEAMDYEAREKHRMREVLDERALDDAKRQAADNSRKIVEARDMAVLTKLEEAAERIPDLMKKVTADDFAISSATIDFLHDSDRAGEIAAYLVDHKEEAEWLFDATFTGDEKRKGTATRLSMREADRFLARLEQRLAPRKDVAPKPSAAPDPGTTLNGGKPAAEQLSLNELSQRGTSHYVERRLAQIRAGAGKR